MYLLSQIWIYLLLAALLGALIAYLFNLCSCDKSGLEAELHGVRTERDDLSARLAAGAGGVAAGAAVSTAGYDRRIAGLEAELAEARVKADELAAAKAKTSAEPALDDEDTAAMKWRNRYLEARVKFLEEQSAGAPIAAGLAGAVVGAVVAAPKAETVSNENFTPSSLAGLSGEELEKATLAAAGNAKAPPRSRKKSNPDDLLLIDGVGPKNNAWLNEQGIYYFHQIATMNIEQVAWLAENLPTFGSRVYRENWVAQCTNLARGLPTRG
jgi:predicted flap endonuclease-1-like 5' DNA nuclease